MRREDRDRVFWERKARQYDRVAMGLFGRPLRQALEQAGLRVNRSEMVPGLIPIAYVESVLGEEAPWRE